MIPLALTSTTGWIRRLGGRNWNLLHKLIYITALAAVLHYYWKVSIKLPPTNPMNYGIWWRPCWRFASGDTLRGSAASEV